MRGDAGDHGKDADLCLHCRGPKPPSLGAKPRKFCCNKCCREWHRGRPNSRCGDCVDSDEPPRAAPRSVFSEERSCPHCRLPFTVTSRTRRQIYCSQKCGRQSPCFKDSIRRSNARRAEKYRCLCCGVLFQRKRYGSEGKKYCSRECAFEARRRRLPVAVDTRRHGGLTQSLASWFLSWGDDVYPIITKCKCGQVLKQRKGKPPPRCWHCEERRPCRRCGCELPDERQKYDTLCCSCRADHDAESLARKRRRARLEKSKVGRNNRKRCRYYGVPYTPIKLRDIYERDNWTCQACGCALRREWDSNDPARCRTIDHIIPLSAGPGSPGHVPSNVRACCWSCNTAKGDSFEPASTHSLH